MERPLTAPVFLRPVSSSTSQSLSPSQTHQLLTTFLSHRSSSTMPSTSFSQLERLSDHLGVISGIIPKEKADEKDRLRVEAEEKIRAETKARREAELVKRKGEAAEVAEKEKESWETQLEGLEDDGVRGKQAVVDEAEGDQIGEGGYEEMEESDDEEEGAGLRDTAEDQSEVDEDAKMV